MNFEQLGLGANTLRALQQLGFTEPTPIQEQAIPLLLAGDIDLLGLAQTGTGKTAAFAIPIIEKINFDTKNPQALILCPTRELCLQITADIEKYTAFEPGIRAVAIYGGASISTQIRELRRGVQIIVATPGRMIDVIDRGEVKFNDVKTVVLDEADEMLNMGFKESINQILSNTPEEKNTWLFTATMPRDIKIITKKYMKDPVEVSVSVNKGNDNIDHEYYVVNPRDRYKALKRIVDFNPEIFGIVFCRTKNETKDIADMLIKDGYNSDALHGDLTQQQRDVVMGRYRDRSLQLLIATDVAARGIDVSNVTHVINFALPDDIENYTHRSGRTARAGKKGIAISLVTKRETQKIYELERMLERKFISKNVPTGDEVCEIQLLSLIAKAKAVEVNEEQMAPFMDKITAEFEEMSKEEVIKRFAALEFNRFLDYYKNADDMNTKDRSSTDGRRERTETGAPIAQSGFTRFFINLGSLDNVRRGDLLRIVCDASNIKGTSVGRIDMKDKFSFFEVENEFKTNIIEGTKGLNYQGRTLRVDEAGEARSSERGERTDRSGGSGFGARREYGGNREGGFGGGRSGGNREGGFGGNRGGGFGGNREGGFGGRSGGNREGGYGGGNRSGGFGGNREGGYGGNRERNSGGNREGGFGGNRENSFSGNREERKPFNADEQPKKRENKFPYSLD